MTELTNKSDHKNGRALSAANAQGSDNSLELNSMNFSTETARKQSAPIPHFVAPEWFGTWDQVLATMPANQLSTSAIEMQNLSSGLARHLERASRLKVLVKYGALHGIKVREGEGKDSVVLTVPGVGSQSVHAPTRFLDRVRCVIDRAVAEAAVLGSAK